MMHKYIGMMIVFSVCNGCVSVINDSTIGSYEPAKVRLRDYAGTYMDEAVYSTPANMMGLIGDTTLGGLLMGRKFGGDVNIRVTKAREIVVTCDVGDHDYGPIHYTEGEDFEFVDHSIVFSPNRDFGTADAPAIGYASSKMRWLIDKEGRLVTIKGAGGAGMVTVVPMAVWGKTVAVFERRE